MWWVAVVFDGWWLLGMEMNLAGATTCLGLNIDLWSLYFRLHLPIHPHRIRDRLVRLRVWWDLSLPQGAVGGARVRSPVSTNNSLPPGAQVPGRISRVLLYDWSAR